MTQTDRPGILLESGTNEVEFLQFSVGAQRYGLNVAKVRQIMTYQPKVVAELPGAPSSIAGIVYFRGEPSPVIDLRKYLRKVDEVANSERTLLIMTEINKHTTGIIIDEVHGITRITWDQFDPMSADVASSNNINIVGTVHLDDTITMILDLESVLGELIPSASLQHFVKDVPACTDNGRDNVRIIYCEDSTTLQRLMLKTLNGAGFNNVKIFQNGDEGLSWLKQHGSKEIDIVPTDIEMPKMDGLTFCKQLRTLKGFESTPVVFFSSMITEEMKNKCRAVGGTSAFSKPEIHSIVKEIDTLLGIVEK